MIDAGFIGDLAAALSFLALTLVLSLSWKGRAPGVFLVVASGATALWAAAAAYNALEGGPIEPVVAVLEVLRSAGWNMLLWSALVLGMRQGGTVLYSRICLAATAALCLLVLGLDLYPVLVGGLLLPFDTVTGADFGRLGLAVIGLVLVENLFRNIEPGRRWAIKHLCFGVGGILTYDVFLFTDAILGLGLSYELEQARGAINALIVPLIAVSVARNTEWSLDVSLSRHVAFHAATLVATGAYMLVMAAIGYYLRKFGGSWGPLLQLGFLFAAVIVLSIMLFSDRFRAHLKVLLNKHFFRYKYDYREEWLNFIHTISSGEHNFNLLDRTVQAIANIVDSPKGGLWLEEEPGSLIPVAAWNITWPADEEPIDGPFARFLERRQWVINLDELAQQPEIYSDFACPDWVHEMQRAWLIVPLIHERRLLGFIILGQPRAPRKLNWEDYDLLKTVGCQAASYLALEQAARALAEARQFEAFNRRFAFVLHDVKNLVSQLSLMVKSAAKHGDNPAFQDDMIRTVRDSVGKMNRLLVRLHADSAVASGSVVELAPLLRKTVAEMNGTSRRVVFDCQAVDLAVAAEEDRLAAVVEHLIQNALEASPEDGVVQVRLRDHDSNAIIEIADRGHGMDAKFVRDDLFRPFKTTKGTGYGIGVYESREFVREMGGRLDVFSEPGEGTTMRVSLPTIGGLPETDENRLKATAQ